MMNRVVEFIPAEWISRSAGANPRLVCYSRPIVVERRSTVRDVTTSLDVNTLLFTLKQRDR